MNAENLAQLFHETYERLAPEHDYETRKETAIPWEQIPPDNANKQLMIAVATEVLHSQMEELRVALLNLDALRVKASSVTSWLSSDGTREKYDKLRKSLEAEVPGFEIGYVDLGYRSGHVLVPKESEEASHG